MLSSLITVVKESMVSSISLITGSSSVFLFLFWQKHERKKKQANQRSRKLKLTAETEKSDSERRMTVLLKPTKVECFLRCLNKTFAGCFETTSLFEHQRSRNFSLAWPSDLRGTFQQ